MQEKTIGEKVREYRQKQGMTQDALAAELHISSQAVSKWETGQTMPDINLLVPISKVLRIGLNDLLGTDRRAEFEHRWQQMACYGEDMALLVAEEALEEFPDDRDFLYRRACDCFFLGKSKKDKHYLDRACFYFHQLHIRYPDDDSYISFLARAELERGNRDIALDYAYKIKDHKVRAELVAKCLGGDEKIRYGQKDLKTKFDDLYYKLLNINTRASIDAAKVLLDALMPESKNLRRDCGAIITLDARLCLEEGNVEGFAQKYREAYEVAKKYYALPHEPIAYTDPLFDHLTHVPENSEALRDFICHLASFDKLLHPALLDLRREVVRENIKYRPLHRHEWKNYFSFCRAYTCKDNCYNFGMSYHMTQEEERAQYESVIERKGGSERLVEMWLGQVERYVGGGIAKGTVACFENEFFGFCHCGEKDSFVCLGIPEEERAIPTAPEGSKILSIVELMIASNFKRCGMEEKLITRAFEDAIKEGYTHAEVYLLERMLRFPDIGRFDELLEIYTRLGFKIVRDLSNEKDGRYYIMQRPLCHVSLDSLADFEFHDSEWSFVSWENGDLAVKIRALNIHKDAAQNGTGKDMELGEAVATFFGIKNITYELPRTWKKDENGNSYTDEPRVIYEGDEAMARFIEELKNEHGVTVMYFDKKDEGYELGAIGNEWLSPKFDFDSVRIEWDVYDGKAWYEGHKSQKKDLLLSTPSGDVTVEASFREHNVPVYNNGVRIDPDSMTVTVTYDGKAYWSTPSCHTWEAAFASLQRSLPEGVKIKCCLTCAHGNFCPYGNKSGEIFCLKNDKPKNKLDVCDLLNGTKDLDETRKELSFVCTDYREASEDHYAYNDYLHCLKKLNKNI